MNARRNRSIRLAGGAILVRAALLLAVLISPVLAQDAGVIATLDGTAEIGRQGTFAPAVIGSKILVGDTIRTGKPGRVRITFRDDSVVTVGDDSELTINEQVFNPTGGEVRSVLDLLNGKVRAIVSEHYKEPQATYELRTTTAVSGVRGTDFIMVHDAGLQRTEVVGITGLVDVNGTVDLNRNGVVIGAQEITQVNSGGYPSPPRRLDQTTFRQYLDGLEFVGQGVPEGLLFDNPVLLGQYVPPADRAETQTGGETAGEFPAGAGGAGPAIPPWEMPDVSQSIDQPPGAAEGGQVGVGF